MNNSKQENTIYDIALYLSQFHSVSPIYRPLHYIFAKNKCLLRTLDDPRYSRAAAINDAMESKWISSLYTRLLFVLSKVGTNLTRSSSTLSITFARFDSFLVRKVCISWALERFKELRTTEIGASRYDKASTDRIESRIWSCVAVDLADDSSSADDVEPPSMLVSCW